MRMKNTLCAGFALLCTATSATAKLDAPGAPNPPAKQGGFTHALQQVVCLNSGGVARLTTVLEIAPLTKDELVKANTLVESYNQKIYDGVVSMVTAPTIFIAEDAKQSFNRVIITLKSDLEKQVGHGLDAAYAVSPAEKLPGLSCS